MSTIFADADSPTVIIEGIALSGLLLLLSRHDWRDMRLPNSLTLSLALCGFAFVALKRPEQLPSAFLGAALGWMSLTVVALAYQGLRNRSGLGGGDAKLLGAGGVWVTWSGLPPAVLIACLSGLLFALVSGRTQSAEPMPFGPFLAFGIWIAWLLGPDWPLLLAP